MTSTKSRILLGQIASAHGIRGELLVKSFAAEPEDIAAYGPLENESGAGFVSLSVVRITPKGVIARVKGVEDRTAAEKMKGTKLYVQRAKLPKPAPGEYYHADLIGLKAIDAQGNALGEIIAVPNFGAGDLIEIRRQGSAQTDLVPLTDTFVPAIDIDQGTATVVLPVLSENAAFEEEPET